MINLHLLSFVSTPASYNGADFVTLCVRISNLCSNMFKMYYLI